MAKKLRQLGFDASKVAPQSQTTHTAGEPGLNPHEQLHFVVYHNPDVMGALTSRQESFEIVTSKSVDALPGNRIWLISGDAHPRRFFLHSTFVVDTIGQAAGAGLSNRAQGSVGVHFQPPLPIDTHPWFPELKKQMGNFGFGMQRVKDQEIISALQSLLDADHPTAEDTQPTADPATLEARARRLRRRGILTRPVGQMVPAKVTTTSSAFVRDPWVVAEVLKLAAGKCQLCDQPAPFSTVLDEPFLEVHHVKLLAERGPDIVANAVALCPNCHRRMHHAKDSAECRERMYSRLPHLKRY